MQKQKNRNHKIKKLDAILTVLQTYKSAITLSLLGLMVVGVVVVTWTYQAAQAAKPSTKSYNITITDHGFQPAFINGSTGVPLKIHVKNSGTKVHNFVLPAYFIFSPNLNVGESTNIEFTPDKRGTFSFYSDTPGSPEPGLKGQLSVN